MSESKEALAFNEATDCVICFEKYDLKTHVPIILHDKHLICHLCLVTLIEKITSHNITTMPCPLCKQSINIQNDSVFSSYHPIVDQLKNQLFQKAQSQIKLMVASELLFVDQKMVDQIVILIESTIPLETVIRMLERDYKLEDFLVVLKQFNHDIKILTIGLLCLRRLLMKRENEIDQFFLQHQVLEWILLLLDLHPTNVYIQLHSLFLLSTMLQTPTQNRENVYELDQFVIQAMARHINSSEVQILSLSIIQDFIRKFKNSPAKKIFHMDETHFIELALIEHPHDEKLQKKGYSTLKLIKDNTGSPATFKFFMRYNKIMFQGLREPSIGVDIKKIYFILLAFIYVI